MTNEIDGTARLAGETFTIDAARGRKGLLRTGDAWFHYSQRGATAKLRRLTVDGHEEPDEIKLDDDSQRGKLEALAAEAEFFHGWSIAEAPNARDRILAGETFQQPRKVAVEAKVVPQTKLRHFYEMLRTFGTRDVCASLLKSYSRRSSDLVTVFAESYVHFSAYDNPSDDFGDDDTRRRKPGGDQFAHRLARELQSAGWDANPDLAFDYVSREVSPLRTQRGRYEDGRPATSSGSGGMDLLLRSRRDGFPILGEIKAAGDTNLFLALIQTLTYASELATPAQRRRLTLPKYGFAPGWAERPTGPYLDIYLIYEDDTDEELKTGTMRLADALLGNRDPRLASIIRRIAFLRCPNSGGLGEIACAHIADTNERRRRMFQLEKNYSRIEIAAALGIKNTNEIQCAVLIGAKGVAIVVNKQGAHPTEPPFLNELTEDSFTMEGRDDGRGGRIEQKNTPFFLFFSESTNGEYAYKGQIVFETRIENELTQLTGRPIRRYKRVEQP